MRKITFLLSLTLTCLFSCIENSSSKRHIETKNIDSDHANFKKIDTTYMYTGFYFLTEEENNRVNMKEEGSNDIYSLSKIPFASVNNISQTELKTTKLENGNYTQLCMTFDSKGTRDLEHGTGNDSQPKIAVVITGKLLYVVDNSTKIKTGVMCVGLVGYSDKQMNEMKKAVDQKK
jgi:hypothetical protein